jgi:hypothetical protein
MNPVSTAEEARPKIDRWAARPTTSKICAFANASVATE